MSIPFSAVPDNLRIPFVTGEFDPSGASEGDSLLVYRALLIGQKITAGTAAANSLHRVTSADQVATLAGRGSLLHQMAVYWFLNNTSTEVWIGVVEDNAAGVAASGTFTFTGTATAAGTVPLYIGGVLVEVAVASGDAHTAVAAAAEAALDANTDLPITSAVASGVVTSTFRHKGLTGNGLDLRYNYVDTDALPAGISLSIAAMSGGTTAPTLTTLIANMGDIWFNVIVHPYTDATSLSAIEAEGLSRFGPMRMIDMLAITAASGSHGTLTTLGASRNSPASCILASPSASPVSPPWAVAAAAGAHAAFYGAQDPAAGFEGLVLNGILPPAATAEFDNTERNNLLFDGIATTRVGAGGVVMLDRLITTYQTNAAGSADTAYLDATTPLTLAYLRYDWRAFWTSKYVRYKLADDGVVVGPGQKVVTPKDALGEALDWYKRKMLQGLVENYDAFKRDLRAARNTTNRNRLDMLLRPDLINQLQIMATAFGFRV